MGYQRRVHGIIRIVFFSHLFFIMVIFSLSHPIRLRISLIIMAILARIITFTINSSWFFYLIILVFLGGVIILIIYISTLAANEKYKNIINFISINNTAVGILYESSNFTLSLFLILYLLLTLVCVVKLVKFESGPLIKRL